MKQGEVQNDHKTEGETNFDILVLPHCFPCYALSAKYLFLFPLKAVFEVFAICRVKIGKVYIR